MRTVGVHVCILAHVDHSEPVEIRGHLLRVGSLQPCMFQKFHSGGRAWRQCLHRAAPLHVILLRQGLSLDLELTDWLDRLEL